MTFGYRELSTQVLLDASEGDKSPCNPASCRHGTRDDDQDCDNCSTTEEFPTENCPPKPGDGDHKKALALLHQQLQDALSAG